MLRSPCLQRVTPETQGTMHEQRGSWTPLRTSSKVTAHLQLPDDVLLVAVQEITELPRISDPVLNSKGF